MPTVEKHVAATAENLTPDAVALARMLAERYSCRAYRPDPVPHDLITRMLEIGQNAASWCNSQPWQVHVVTGDGAQRFRDAFYGLACADAAAGNFAGSPDLDFPAAYRGVYKERQREVGWQLYDAVGVAFGDRVGSARQALENFRMFGAPHALVISTPRDLGTYGVLDCGSYLGTLMLSAQSLGIGMIPQAAFAVHAPFLREFFAIPDDRAVVCGASFGFADTAHPANSFRSRRASLDDAVSWVTT